MEFKPYNRIKIDGEFKSIDKTVIISKLGDYLSKKYKVPFYFPSPDHWDDDCPNWWEQSKGIKCEDCGKIVIPSDSKYLQKNICFHCHTIRESNDKIKNDKLNPIFIHLYFEKDNKISKIYSNIIKFSMISRLIIEHFDEYDKKKLAIFSLLFQAFFFSFATT